MLLRVAMFPMFYNDWLCVFCYVLICIAMLGYAFFCCVSLLCCSGGVSFCDVIYIYSFVLPCSALFVSWFLRCCGFLRSCMLILFFEMIRFAMICVVKFRYVMHCYVSRCYETFGCVASCFDMFRFATC